MQRLILSSCCLAVFALVLAWTTTVDLAEAKGKRCQSDDDCAIGSLCERGRCKNADCGDVYDPVCGVDGQTYPNACEARLAHVEIAYYGECRTICGGIQGLLCPEGQVCIFADGECDILDNQGRCLDRPQACTEEYAPVCGCDGKTYGNRCMAIMAGVSVDYIGECVTCSLDEVLVDGKCVPKCYGDQDCPDGHRCNAAEVCLPDPACPACAVCVGWCVPPPCWDGTPLLCDALMPDCQSGSVPTIQDGCWVCVDPETCKPDPCAEVDLPPCEYDACPPKVEGRCGARCKPEGFICGNEIGEVQKCVDGRWACAINPPGVPGCNKVCRME